MANPGWKWDVLIEDTYDADEATGMQTLRPRTFVVWADKGLKRVIAKAPGVASVIYIERRYVVFLDPRYDREYVKREVEAAVLCGKPA